MKSFRFILRAWQSFASMQNVNDETEAVCPRCERPTKWSTRHGYYRCHTCGDDPVH